MPALNNTQLSILRTKPQTSNFYLFPVLPQIAFQAQINDPAITVGAVVITYDNVTLGTFGGILAGMTLWVGSAAGLYDIARIRIRGANATTITVAENADVAWADDLFLTVIFQWLPWGVRPRIVSGTVYKDYNIAYTDQTDKWPPVSMMGDPAIKFFDSSPTNVYFDGSESYAVAQGATITGHAWDFGDGTNSAVATPGNHPYFVTGQYWANHTVTDSNGKTHVTYRPVCIIDRTSAYVNFRCDSMSGSIDAGWVAKFTVFGNAPLSAFPERAPIFFFSDDYFGSNAGSQGFPLGRENVIMFGYIQEDSVTKNPETGDITFDVAGIARAMERISMYPATTQDKTTPSAWTEAKNLNIFRSFVFLLKFHTTVMDVADVFLYNDTTPIRVTNFPEDNLWNMFAQFAKGARMMRVGATRTGRVVLGRDPNLVAIASRGTIPVVMQLAQGDWVGQVTMPEQPYPLCAYLCLGGLTYDGTPAHESNPLFGMSPGRPNKEFGDSREIHFLQLLSQTEVNTLAGLALGQINNAFGDVVVEMAGNWTRCFDPALQEYVQAPSSGWVSKRGTLLTNQFLIVRKVELKFNWNGGYVNSSLTCEVYSYPDIGVNGDCFTTDAPLPPIVVTPPIVVKPPVLLTEAPVMTAPSNTCVAGVSTTTLNWTYAGIGSPTYHVERSVYSSAGFAEIGTTGSLTLNDTPVLTPKLYYYRVRGKIGAYYTPYSNVVSQLAQVCAPVAAFDVWFLDQDGMVGRLSAISAGGGTFSTLNDYLVNYEATLPAYRLSPASGNKVMMAANDLGTPNQVSFGKSTDNAATWSNTGSGLTSRFPWIDSDRAAPDNAWMMSTYDSTTYTTVYAWYTTDGGATWNSITLIVGPSGTGNQWLGAALGGTFCYAMVIQNQTTASPLVTFYKILSNGTFTSQSYITAGASNVPGANGFQNDGYVSPRNTDLVFFIGSSPQYSLWTLNWGSSNLSRQLMPVTDVLNDFVDLMFVTVMGTILAGVDDQAGGVASYFLRSTDDGATWTKISLASIANDFLDLGDSCMCETGGVVGVSGGTIVVKLGAFSIVGAGYFIFSVDDGQTWSLSGNIGYTGGSGVASLRART